MPTVFANDGPGSGLNADMLDGLQASSFLSTSSDYGRSGVSSNLYEGTTSLANKYVGKSGSHTITNGNLTVNTSFGIGSTSVTGVEGFAQSQTYGFGVVGAANGSDAHGVNGEATGTNGVGVYGNSTGNSGNGVRGISSGTYSRAVYGEATYTGPTTTHGGYFTANSVNGRGVFGGTSGATGYGVFGWATATGASVQNYGGYFRADGNSGRGVYGWATATGEDVINCGGYFEADGDSGMGVYGISNSSGNYGGLGLSSYGAYGAHETSGNYGALGSSNYGVYGESETIGVRGNHNPTGNFGYLGDNNSGVVGYSSSNSGVVGESSSGYGVVGQSSSSGYGVWGYSSSGYAGYFSGKVHVTGTLTKGGGSFKIDHPLDPENKYLQHSFVESPDMINIYNGNVVLDATGQAWVELPEWFEALNKDFRSQRTCLGGFAQVYIAEEVSENRFKIAGGTAGMKVSWQVTGIRQDPWAEANRIPVEEDKAAEEVGFYLSPESYGQPKEKGIEWGRNPEMMQRMKEMKELERTAETDRPLEGES